MQLYTSCLYTFLSNHFAKGHTKQQMSDVLITKLYTNQVFFYNQIAKQITVQKSTLTFVVTVSIF